MQKLKHARWFRIFVVLGAMLTVGGLSAPTASAHAVLESTSPAASSIVPTSPTEIVLNFDEKIELSLGKIQLFDSDSKLVKTGQVVRDDTDNSIVRASVSTLKDGAYVVVWRMTSADGHPVEGAFAFEVGKTSTRIGNGLVAVVVAKISKSSNLGEVQGIFRLLSFIGVVLLLGLCVLTSAGEILRRSRALLLATVALLLQFIGSLGQLLLQGPYATRGSWGDIFDYSLIGDVISTRLGLAIVVRFVCIAIAVLLLVAVKKNYYDNALWQNTAALVGVALVVTFSASGHASVQPQPVLSMALDALHFGAVSVWMGGLMSLVLLGSLSFDAQTHVSGVQIVNRFSHLATWALPVVVATGVVQSWRLLHGFSTISDSTFGRLLIVKALGVVVVVVLGASARMVLALTGPASIRRGIIAEAVIGIGVLALTAGLVATSPTALSARAQSSSSVTLVQNGLIADLTLTPAVVGRSEIHALFTPQGGSLQAVVSVSARLSLPARDIPTIPVQMVSIGANHWTGVVQVPYSGDWTMEVLVKPTENEQIAFTSVVKIKD